MTKREKNILTSHQQKYIAWQLVRQHSSCDEDKFTSVLAEAQVDLNPHQVDAALFAFHSPLSMSAILADEVGLGKMIEAALVMSQHWAKRIDIFLKATDREVLENAGNITAEYAKEYAESEFEKYRIIQDRLFSSDFDKLQLEGGNLPELPLEGMSETGNIALLENK